MSGGFFRGTTADQDTRFSNKQAKLLKTHKFPPELDQSVDIAKVKMDVIKPWIATRVTELLGFEDEVLINFIYGLLESKNLDGKQIQIQLTGFMEKNTSKFMKELWGLLISAQNNASGVPQQFLDAKQLEIQKKKEESERIMEEIQKKREKEKAEEELERKNKRADETLIPEEEISAKDPTKHNNKSPSRNRKSPLASRSRSNSLSREGGDKWRRRVIRPHRRRRSPSPYRRSGRRYRSPDFAPRRSSPSRRRSPPHSSRRRSPPPPPQRKRSPSPYERPSQEEYRRKDNRRPPSQHFTDADLAEKPRQHTRDRTVISSKIRRLSPDGSPAGSESPDFVPRKSPPQRKRSVSPYGSRSMRDRKVISTKNRHSPSPHRNESARYKRRHDSPEMSPDEEPAPPARKSEIVRPVHEPSESPDERDNNYGPKRKQKESFSPDDYNNYNNDDYVPKRKSKDENKEYVKSNRYQIEEEEEEEEYGPGSFKKQQKKKMGEFSSEYETEKRHKGKRKQKKYEKHSDESSEESELSDEEFRRKRREKERPLKNEEKREKYEEKRKRKSEVRNEDFGDEESEEEERQKRLEVELREKALQSLRAKKGSSNR